jgi:type II secretory pathway pseudopilin PulG
MRRCYRHLWSSTDLSPAAKSCARAAELCAPSSRWSLRTGPSHRSRAGFAVGPILYLLALIGIGAGILFSGYSQILRSNVQITENMQAQNDLAQAATVLAASSILGSSDNMVLCPPTSGSASANCSLSSLKLESFAAAAAAGGSAQLPTNYASAGTTGTPAGFEVGVFAPGSGMKQLDPYGR